MSNVNKKFNEFIKEDYGKSLEQNNDDRINKLRSVTVKYSDGTEISTSMAKGLTNEEIYDYFKVGKKFNIGLGPQDNVQEVVEVTINDLEENEETLNNFSDVSSVWDNGGESNDRYTIILNDGNALGMSEHPTNPTGFSQFVGQVEPGEHLGEEIKVEELPLEVRNHLADRLS